MKLERRSNISYIAEVKVERVMKSCVNNHQRLIAVSWARRLFRRGIISVDCIYNNNLFFSPEDKATF